MRTIFFIFVAFWSGSIFADSNKINFERTDLRAVAMDQGVAWVQLKPEASSRFEEFSKANKGNAVELYLAGEKVSRFVVVSELSSGSFRISEPTSTTLEVLSGLPDPRDDN